MNRDKKQIPLWKIILERHKYTGRLLRPRVPLVFLRLRSFPEALPSRRSLQPWVTQYPLHLHFQLSFPWAQTIVRMNSVANAYALVMDQRNHLHPRSIVYRAVAGAPQATTPRHAQRVSQARDRHELTRGFHASSHRNTNDERSETRSTEKTITSTLQTRESKEIQRALSSSAITTHIVSNFTRSVMSALPAMRMSVPAQRALAYNNSQLNHAQINHAQFNHKQVTHKQSNPNQINYSRINYEQINHASIGEQIFHYFKSISPLKEADSPTLRVMPPVDLMHGLRAKPEVANDPVRPFVGFAFPKPQHQELRPSTATTANQPLYAQSVSRTFAAQPQHGDAAQPQTHHQSTPPPVRVSAPAPPPPLDIARLSDAVYRHIQQKIRVDRERRGL